MDSSQAKRKTPTIVVNVIESKYPVIRRVCKMLGWRTSRLEEEPWDIWWADSGISAEKLSNMKTYQKTNHFPGMHGVTRKNHLARNLTRMRKLFPLDYDFFPLTWSIPADMPGLRRDFRNRYVIVKPEAASQGKGIFITNKIDEIPTGENFVVQEYINNPFLIDGLKFDLRLYVLVAGSDPLKIFLHEDGLTRFATRPFQKATQSNKKSRYMHLTNYAINRRSTKFVKTTEADTGHKRTLHSTWDYLRQQDYDVNSLMQQIQDAIIKTLITVQPTIAHTYKSVQSDDPSNAMCFELLGFDIMLDENLKPFVLEVNQSPSFSTSSKLDRKIKSKVMYDTFVLMNMDLKNKRDYYEKRKQDIKLRSMQKKNTVSTKEIKLQNFKLAQKARNKYEKYNLGGYIQLFPRKETDKYNQFLEQANNIWLRWTGTRQREEKKQSPDGTPVKGHNAAAQFFPPMPLPQYGPPRIIEKQVSVPEVFRRLSKTPNHRANKAKDKRDYPGVKFDLSTSLVTLQQAKEKYW